MAQLRMVPSGHGMVRDEDQLHAARLVLSSQTLQPDPLRLQAVMEATQTMAKTSDASLLGKGARS